jgi:prepilin-type N-terminal cleavage/methylation domain-containing protein
MLSPRHAFTLIELLVVIGIIAILSVVVILTLNPAELLKQSRDSNRLSDMATMNSALGIYAEDVGGSMGTPSTTYLSVPDPSAGNPNACPSLALPAQSAGWTYQCASSSSYRNVDSTGWIPLNFTEVSSGAPAGTLPKDPINQTSSNLFYTYTTDGKTYEVTATMESQQYRGQLSTNPPLTLYPGIEALGSNLSLSGLWNPSGLVGNWNFEEGAGSSTIDQSGNGNNGTWIGTPAGNNGTYYARGKVGHYAGAFDGTSTYVNVPLVSSGTITTNTMTFTAWIDSFAAQNNYTGVIFSRLGSYALGVEVHSPGNTLSYTWNATFGWNSGLTIPNSQWSFVAIVITPVNAVGYLGSGDSLSSSINSLANPSQALNKSFRIGDDSNSPLYYFNGLIDDARIYNRALSVAEIQALYNAQK